jgi:hypothetical protein
MNSLVLLPPKNLAYYPGVYSQNFTACENYLRYFHNLLWFASLRTLTKCGKHLLTIVLSTLAMFPVNAFLHKSEMHGFGFLFCLIQIYANMKQ